ncbi:8947_t:CDS:2, partial [Paraglomus occultum]
MSGVRITLGQCVIAIELHGLLESCEFNPKVNTEGQLAIKLAIFITAKNTRRMTWTNEYRRELSWIVSPLHETIHDLYVKPIQSNSADDDNDTALDFARTYQKTQQNFAIARLKNYTPERGEFTRLKTCIL